MTDDRNNMDKLFRDALHDAELSPPAHVWEVLETRLRQKKETRAVLWIRYAAAIVLVLIAIQIGMEISNVRQQGMLAHEQGQIPQVVTGQDLPQAHTGVHDGHGKSITGEDHSGNQAEATKSAGIAAVGREKHQQPGPGSVDTGPLTAEVTAVLKASPGSHPVSDPQHEDLHADMARSVIRAIPAITHVDLSLVAGGNGGILAVRGAKVNERPLQRSTFLASGFDEDRPATTRSQKLPLLSLAGNYSPMFSAAASMQEEMDLLTVTYSSPGKQEEGQLISWGTGLEVRYAPGRKVALSTGLNYLSYTLETTNPLLHSDGSDPSLYSASTSLGRAWIPVDMISDAQEYYLLDELYAFTSYGLKQHLQYIELPLMLNYYLMNRKSSISIGGGFYSSFLTGSRSVFSNGTGPVEAVRSDDIPRINFGIMLGVGYELRIHRSIYMSARPGMRYSLKGLHTESGRLGPFIPGITAGIGYIIR